MIQDALNRATEVTMSGDTYLISARITVTVSNMTFRGFGRSTVLQATTQDMEMVRLWEVDDISSLRFPAHLLANGSHHF